MTEAAGAAPLLLDRAIAAGQPAAEPARRGRALHVINGDDYSGAERVQDLLGLRLPDEGYDVVYGCLKPGLFEIKRRSQDVPLVDAPMRGRFDLRPGWRLAKLARETGCDVIHTHSVRTALVGRVAAALTGLPIVHHMHCQTAVEVGQTILKRVNAFTERLSLRGVAGVIAVSDTIADYVRQQGIPAERITVIPNGVPGLEALPQRIPPSGTWTVGTVAMFRPRKGIETLIDAVGRLRTAGHDVRLCAVGRFQTPEYAAEVRALVGRMGLAEAVDWTGFTTDVPGELKRMDLFVLPSVVAEGMPMAVLEAFAAGVPVIASRVPGVTDIVHHGADGMLVEPADSAVLASAIEGFIQGQSDWQALRAAGFAAHREHYSDRTMARRVAGLYGRILAGARRRAAAR